MYNLQAHEKNIFYLTGGIALAWILIVGLLIYPRYRAISKINSEITEMRTQLELKYEKTKRLHRSKINLSSAQALVNQYNDLFLKKGEELKLIVALEALAEKYQLSQKISLSPSPRAVTPKLSAFDLSVSVTGDFSNLLNYFDDLENEFVPVAVVTGFNFGTGANGLRKEAVKSGELNLSYKAEVYVRD